MLVPTHHLKFLQGFVGAHQPRDSDRGGQQLPHLPRHDPHAAEQRLLPLVRRRQQAEGQEGHDEHTAAAVGTSRKWGRITAEANGYVAMSINLVVALVVEYLGWLNSDLGFSSILLWQSLAVNQYSTARFVTIHEGGMEL